VDGVDTALTRRGLSSETFCLRQYQLRAAQGCGITAHPGAGEGTTFNQSYRALLTVFLLLTVRLTPRTPLSAPATNRLLFSQSQLPSANSGSLNRNQIKILYEYSTYVPL
jgi:hypothetical protein